MEEGGILEYFFDFLKGKAIGLDCALWCQEGLMSEHVKNIRLTFINEGYEVIGVIRLPEQWVVIVFTCPEEAQRAAAACNGAKSWKTTSSDNPFSLDNTSIAKKRLQDFEGRLRRLKFVVGEASGSSCEDMKKGCLRRGVPQEYKDADYARAFFTHGVPMSMNTEGSI